jgi:hypothetical protein
MKPLEDIPLVYRIALTFAIVVIILILLAAFGYFSGAWDEAGAREEDVPMEKDEAHILALDREALDKAYMQHIGLVFGVWMKDPNDPNSVHRAGNGARNARKGYAISRTKIEERERRLKEMKP